MKHANHNFICRNKKNSHHLEIISLEIISLNNTQITNWEILHSVPVSPQTKF